MSRRLMLRAASDMGRPGQMSRSARGLRTEYRAHLVHQRTPCCHRRSCDLWHCCETKLTHGLRRSDLRLEGVQVYSRHSEHWKPPPLLGTSECGPASAAV